MATKRLFLEFGSGNDLHGADYTKAAVRAVEDAIHHSYISLLRTLQLDPEKMEVEVVIGVQKPEKVDTSTVKATLPYGQVSVNVVNGGLDISDNQADDRVVIASAAIVVRYDLPSS